MENMFQYHVGLCCLSFLWSSNILKVIKILFMASKLVSQEEETANSAREEATGTVGVLLEEERCSHYCTAFI